MRWWHSRKRSNDNDGRERGAQTRMVDEVGIVKGLRDSGVKEEFAHVTAVAGRALARQGRKDRGERYDNGPLRPTPAQAGMLLRRGWFGRLREGFVPNVEMCELEKEMDKDGSVVFRLGWATR